MAGDAKITKVALTQDEGQETIYAIDNLTGNNNFTAYEQSMKRAGFVFVDWADAATKLHIITACINKSRKRYQDTLAAHRI